MPKTSEKCVYSAANAERFYYKMKQQARPKPVKKESNPSRKHMDNQCKLCGSDDVLEVHHIIPVAIGGHTTNTNLITLCNDCHSKITKYYNYIGLMEHRVEWHERSKVGNW